MERKSQGVVMLTTCLTGVNLVFRLIAVNDAVRSRTRNTNQAGQNQPKDNHGKLSAAAGYRYSG